MDSRLSTTSFLFVRVWRSRYNLDLQVAPRSPWPVTSYGPVYQSGEALAIQIAQKAQGY